MTVQYIEQAGRRAFAVLPIDEWDAPARAPGGALQDIADAECWPVVPRASRRRWLIACWPATRIRSRFGGSIAG